ncbi:hypothetical protein GQX74_014249 [Glossina fuscipes]|nr:hypothetical protein GQX74_014249 [Glossina fuscipes]
MKRFKRKNGPTFVLPIIAIMTAGSRHAIIKTLGNTNGIIGQLTNSLTKCGSMECKLTRWGRLFPEHSIPNRVEPSLVLHYYILCMAKTLCHRELADLSRKTGLRSWQQLSSTEGHRHKNKLYAVALELAINFRLIDLSSRFIICDTGITATRTSGRVYAKIELFRQHLLRIVLAPAESLVYHGLGCKNIKQKSTFK